jgi:hypothetical protein
VYQRLGLDAPSRYNAYLDMFETKLVSDENVISAVSRAAQFPIPLDDLRSCELIAVGSKSGYSRRGRPTRTKKGQIGIRIICHRAIYFICQAIP